MNQELRKNLLEYTYKDMNVRMWPSICRDPGPHPINKPTQQSVNSQQ